MVELVRFWLFMSLELDLLGIYTLIYIVILNHELTSLSNGWSLNMGHPRFTA